MNNLNTISILTKKILKKQLKSKKNFLNCMNF